MDLYRRWIAHILVYLLAWLPVSCLRAEIITLEMEQGLIATAEYLQGDEDAPALLIQHGFLQTREFITVRRLADSLHESGYTILLPNLTLGISARQQSLSCEAIHTHSMSQDTREIARWVDWLHQQTNNKLYLIGHSSGSLQLIAYLNAYPDAPITGGILISLIPYGESPASHETAADRLRAKHAQRWDPVSLETYGLVYCKDYLTTPGNYLSYVSWDPPSTLATLEHLAFPITIVLGGTDRRLSKDWRKRLQTIGVKIITVEGTNHFFDHEHEFDLLDAIEGLLK